MVRDKTGRQGSGALQQPGGQHTIQAVGRDWGYSWQSDSKKERRGRTIQATYAARASSLDISESTRTNIYDLLSPRG